ncbi:MAG: hypothetical protein JSW55_02120 [Chloroflexota bacterium]|nr:MAG: hypothetical protein JSW55_02120 [Chloroflexota bacterium]
MSSGHMMRIRRAQLCESKTMTIIILFHESDYRTFKGLYTIRVTLVRVAPYLPTKACISDERSRVIRLY